MDNLGELRKIYITGGTGFFGKALLRHWESEQNGSKKPDLISVLSRDPNKFIKSNPDLSSLNGVELHQGDVTKPNTLISNEFYDGVIHAATDATNNEAVSPLIRFDQIVEGSRNLLDFSVSHGVRRFLLTSSGAVYGKLPGNLTAISEDYKGSPDSLISENAYGNGKRTAEHLCALYANKYGIEIIIARCFAFSGQDLAQNAHYAIGNFINDALWSNEIVVKGDGMSLRSYLDQRDLAIWLVELLNKGRSGEAYNVGSDQKITIADLAYLVRDIVSPKKTVRILSSTDRSNMRSNYVPNIEKISKELGLKPTISLEQSIYDTAKKIAEKNKKIFEN
jgi:dTDP-glucose 4,6-dehydratase